MKTEHGNFTNKEIQKLKLKMRMEEQWKKSSLKVNCLGDCYHSISLDSSSPCVLLVFHQSYLQSFSNLSTNSLFLSFYSLRTPRKLFGNLRTHSPLQLFKVALFIFFYFNYHFFLYLLSSVFN